MEYVSDNVYNKVQNRVLQRYDLNMRRSRASVTIRVRQSGHSREEDMTRSEQLRHIAKWLRNDFRCKWMLFKRDVHPPAINNGNVSFFVLADNTQSISFKVESGSHH